MSYWVFLFWHFFAKWAKNTVVISNHCQDDKVNTPRLVAYFWLRSLCPQKAIMGFQFLSDIFVICSLTMYERCIEICWRDFWYFVASDSHCVIQSVKLILIITRGAKKCLKVNFCSIDKMPSAELSTQMFLALDNLIDKKLQTQNATT